ncbi:MAG: MFS transporter [Firmicutes bacterium]|nr:MFS transporter [Bacillota bacterium]
MEQAMNKKGLIGTFAFATTASATNMTSGILAYIMLTYSEVSPTNVSMVLTIPAIVGTFFAFVSGNLINKFGIKKVTLFTQATAFLSGMIYLLLGNKTSIVILYLAANLFGFMLGGQAVIMGQLFKECIPNDDTRASFLGYGNSVVSLGGVIMATLGGIIAAANNGAHWERAYLLYFWMVICLLIEWITLPNKTDNAKEEIVQSQEKTTSSIPIKVWFISLHYFFFFLFLYAFSLNVSEYVITTHQLGTSAQSGLAISFLTVGGIISGLTFGFYSKILKKKTMVILLTICALGLGFVVFVPNIYVLYVAATMMGMAMMGANPYVVMELSRITDAASYPKAMSIYAGFMNAGMMFAVYILAFLSRMLFGSADSVMGKMTIAFIGTCLVAITAIPLYMGKNRKGE